MKLALGLRVPRTDVALENYSVSRVEKELSGATSISLVGLSRISLKLFRDSTRPP